MARACTICTNPKRSEIELSVANGVSNRRIASQYGMSETSVRRHMAEHIKQAAKEQQAKLDEAKTLDVLKQLQAINATTLRILQAAQANPKTYGLALQAIDRVQKQIELQAKLLGDLNEGTQVDIHLDPQWVNMRELIFRALEAFPEARRALAQVLYEEGQRGRSIA